MIEQPNSKFTLEDIWSTLEYLGALSLGYRTFLDDKGRVHKLEGLDYQQTVSGVIDSWKENREGFKYIFVTEMGSIYFVLHDGKSVRFQKKKDKWSERKVVIFENIFFVEINNEVGSTYRDLLYWHETGDMESEIINKNLKVSSTPKVGYAPFEFKAYGYATPIGYTFEDGVLVINNSEGPFASMYHIGHKIISSY